MAQQGRSPLTSGFAFRKRGATSSMLLREQVLFQDRDDAEASLFVDWWLGAEAVGFALAATEDADTVSADLVEGGSFALAATEATDTLSANVQEGFSLAATEGADTFAGELEEGAAANEFVLAATEEPDTVSLEVQSAATPALFFSYGGPPPSAQAPTRKEVEQEVAASAPDLSAEHRAEVIARVMQSLRSSEALANAMADVRTVNAQIARAAAISNTEARIQALGAQQQALAALVAAEIRAHEIEMENEAILLMAA